MRSKLIMTLSCLLLSGCAGKTISPMTECLLSQQTPDHYVCSVPGTNRAPASTLVLPVASPGLITHKQSEWQTHEKECRQ